MSEPERLPNESEEAYSARKAEHQRRERDAEKRKRDVASTSPLEKFRNLWKQ